MYFLECQQAHNLYHYMRSLQLSNEWEDDDIEGDYLLCPLFIVYCLKSLLEIYSTCDACYCICTNFPGMHVYIFQVVNPSVSLSCDLFS